MGSAVLGHHPERLSLRHRDHAGVLVFYAVQAVHLSLRKIHLESRRLMVWDGRDKLWMKLVVRDASNGLGYQKLTQWICVR